MVPSSMQVSEAFAADTLNLILFSTEKCNFRCFYCYEDFKLGKMPSSIQEGIIQLLNRRAPTLRNLELSWFGGEPLLAVDVIENLCTSALSLAASNGFLYRSNITTNGFHLTHELAERLSGLGVNFYQITLDGDESVH